MRIMIDTNILISIIFFPSARMNEVKTKLSKDHRIVICSWIKSCYKSQVSAQIKSFRWVLYSITFWISIYARVLPDGRNTGHQGW